MSILRATIKVTRLFGVFPLHFLQNGTIRFNWTSLTTVLSVAKALLYSLSILDYICLGVRLGRVFSDISETLHNYCVGKKVTFFHEFQRSWNLFGARGGKLGCVRIFVKQYVELHRSFQIYSGVAAMCIAVLIFEVYAALFCFVGARFVYYKELPPSAFTRLSLYICTSVSVIILLIELGHYMDTKVR